MKEINCLRCGVPMQFMKKTHIQFGKTGWILGDLPNLVAGALPVEIYICPTCMKLEFFATEDGVVEEDALPQKTCPKCGAVHDFDYPKCPICKYDYYGEE